jgi:hypothetical protein
VSCSCLCHCRLNGLIRVIPVNGQLNFSDNEFRRADRKQRVSKSSTATFESSASSWPSSLSWSSSFSSSRSTCSTALPLISRISREKTQFAWGFCLSPHYFSLPSSPYSRGRKGTRFLLLLLRKSLLFSSISSKSSQCACHPFELLNWLMRSSAAIVLYLSSSLGTLVDEEASHRLCIETSLHNSLKKTQTFVSDGRVWTEERHSVSSISR